jgi:hypothetical protein
MLAISTLRRAYQAMPPGQEPRDRDALPLRAEAAGLLGRTPSSTQE